MHFARGKKVAEKSRRGTRADRYIDNNTRFRKARFRVETRIKFSTLERRAGAYALPLEHAHYLIEDSRPLSETCLLLCT